MDATARTKILNFTSNIAALIFFILAGLPIWELGLVMAVGGFMGAQLGAKVVVTKGQKWIRPLVIVMSMLMASKLLWNSINNGFYQCFNSWRLIAIWSDTDMNRPNQAC